MFTHFRYHKLPEWLRWVLWLPFSWVTFFFLVPSGVTYGMHMLGLFHSPPYSEFFFMFSVLASGVFFPGFFVPDGRMGVSIFVALLNIGYMLFEIYEKGFAAYNKGTQGGFPGALVGIVTGLALIRLYIKKYPNYFYD